MMRNKNLVYLAYGRETEYRRAIFSILTLQAWYSGKENIRINLYTDKPEFFTPWLSSGNIAFHMLSAEMQQEMIADTTYVHRIKIGVIALTFQQYPDEDLLFIDADTFFTADPSPLLADYVKGESYMHKREFTLEEGAAIFRSYGQGEYPEALLRYLSAHEIHIEGKPEKFDGQAYSWNSGVLGLHHSFAKEMPEVFRLSDLFYLHSRWFISEQLAFAFILQRTTRIIPAEQQVLHYWGKREKLFFDRLIPGYLEHSLRSTANPAALKALTLSWQQQLHIDTLVEQAALAINQHSWYYAAKKIVQLTLKSPAQLPALLREIRAGKPVS